jgi:hypothetical protein
MTLMTSFVQDPKRNISLGSTAAVVTLFVTSISLIFVASSLPPGLRYTQTLENVMSPGLMDIFKCSSQVAWILILPGQFAMAWGFVVPYGKLLHAMAQSNLLPSFFMLKGDRSSCRK